MNHGELGYPLFWQPPLGRIQASWDGREPKIRCDLCQNPRYPCSSHQNSWDLWMFIPLKMVLIGIDPYPYETIHWIRWVQVQIVRHAIFFNQKKIHGCLHVCFLNYHQQGSRFSMSPVEASRYDFIEFFGIHSSLASILRDSTAILCRSFPIFVLIPVFFLVKSLTVVISSQFSVLFFDFNPSTRLLHPTHLGPPTSRTTPPPTGHKWHPWYPPQRRGPLGWKKYPMVKWWFNG